jgi:hypothetical protein
MGIRDLRRHGVGVGRGCRACSLLERWDECGKCCEGVTWGCTVELVPCWNNEMNGYLALLRGALCVSRGKGELDNL